MKSKWCRKKVVLICLLTAAGFLVVFLLRHSDSSPPVPGHAALPASKLGERLAPKNMGAPSESTGPIETVRIVPQNVYVGTVLQAEVSFRNPEKASLPMEYQWKCNGENVFGGIFFDLDTSSFKKGDKISVTVAPGSGPRQGEEKVSEEVVILNQPPEIVSLPSTATIDGLYVYNVEATDPDDDPLTYSLDQAPPGMRIDAGTGRMEWPVPLGMEGNFAVRLIVSDGTAKIFQSFTISLKTELNNSPLTAGSGKSPGN